MGRHRFDQGQESQVEQQDLVFGMVGDIGDLLRMQARIDRMQHGAGTGHGVVGFHMAVAIPRQRGDAVAHLDAHALQGMGQLAGALAAIAVGIAVQVAFDAP